MGESEVSKLYGELRELNAKVDKLTEAFNHAAHGDGFNRCSRHSVRIKNVENSVELSHRRISGVKKWMVGALITIAAMAANHAWSILQSAAKHQ
jgi:hypothetical protein